MLDVTRPLDPHYQIAYVEHWERSLSRWQQAAGALLELRPDEAAAASPVLERCFAAVRDRGAYLAQLEVRLAEATAAYSRLPPLIDELAPYLGAMLPMLAVELDRARRVNGPAVDVLEDVSAADVRRFLDELVAVDGLCRARVPHLTGPLPANLHGGRGGWSEYRGVRIPSEALRDPAVWCFVGRERVRLMTAALAQHRFLDGGLAGRLREAAAQLGHGELPIAAADLLAEPVPPADRPRLIAEERAWYAAAGIPPPATPLVAHDAELARLHDDVLDRADDVRLGPPAWRELRLEALGRALVAARAPASAIVATAMEGRGPAVELRDDGTPLQRWGSGRVLLRRPGAAWCETRRFTYVEPFAGGTYRLATSVQLGDTAQLMSCDP